MTNQMYRGFHVIKTALETATTAPKNLMYRGVAHTGIEAATPASMDLVYRGVAFTKLESGRIVVDAAQPIAMPGLAAAA